MQLLESLCLYLSTLNEAKEIQSSSIAYKRHSEVVVVTGLLCISEGEEKGGRRSRALELKKSALLPGLLHTAALVGEPYALEFEYAGDFPEQDPQQQQQPPFEEEFLLTLSDEFMYVAWQRTNIRKNITPNLVLFSKIKLTLIFRGAGRAAAAGVRTRGALQRHQRLQPRAQGRRRRLQLRLPCLFPLQRRRPRHPRHQAPQPAQPAERHSSHRLLQQWGSAQYGKEIIQFQSCVIHGYGIWISVNRKLPEGAFLHVASPLLLLECSCSEWFVH